MLRFTLAALPLYRPLNHPPHRPVRGPDPSAIASQPTKN